MRETADPIPDAPDPNDTAGGVDAQVLRRALAPPRPRHGLRVLAQLVASLGSFAALALAVFWLLVASDTPLAPEWNPIEPLDLSRPATPLTGFKVRRAAATEGTCLAALATGAGFEAMTPFRAEDRCHIDPRVKLSAVGGARIAPVETHCATALRLAAWERHVVGAASDLLGSPVAALSHQGSYNCRSIRGGTRMSSHATAGAIDINGVVLADGRRVPLLGNWEGEGSEARFWRALRDGGCAWFGTVLGPEFDSNHADHLHLQARGWGTCR